ncbi:MAG: hypothetical protein HC829_02870 [Bacteroidales bacterium]|nr:hypothetical protein [Bacteroidales bacterium]
MNAVSHTADETDRKSAHRPDTGQNVAASNRTVDIHLEPEPQKLDALIEINRNSAASLSAAA